MKYKVIATITGMQRSEGAGKIEGVERSWDSTKIHVMQNLSDKNGNGRGFCTVMYKIGKSANYDALIKVDLPCDFELEFHKTTNGKGDTIDEILSFTPIVTQSKQAKAA